MSTTKRKMIQMQIGDGVFIKTKWSIINTLSPHINIHMSYFILILLKCSLHAKISKSRNERTNTGLFADTGRKFSRKEIKEK